MRKLLVILLAALLLALALVTTASAEVVNPGNACAQEGGANGIFNASVHGGNVRCAP